MDLVPDQALAGKAMDLIRQVILTRLPRALEYEVEWKGKRGARIARFLPIDDNEIAFYQEHAQDIQHHPSDQKKDRTG